MNSILAGALLALFVAVQAEMGLEFPVHDGKTRLLNLSKKNFDRFIKKSDILVVYKSVLNPPKITCFQVKKVYVLNTDVHFTMPLDESDEKGIRHWELTKQMLEVGLNCLLLCTWALEL